jgi:hypothetical protein
MNGEEIKMKISKKDIPTKKNLILNLEETYFNIKESGEDLVAKVNVWERELITIKQTILFLKIDEEIKKEMEEKDGN